MFEKIHTLQQSLEKKVTKEQSVFVRLAFMPLLFFVFLIHAILYSISILLFPAEKSFTHIHNIYPEEDNKERMNEHKKWSKRVRRGSVGTLVASIAITSLIVSAVAGKLPVFAAGDCTLDVDTVTSPIDVDSYIGSSGGCGNLTVEAADGSGTATLQFTDDEVDIDDGGTLTIGSGVTVVFSGALNFPSGTVVNEGTITHDNEDATGVSITAVDIVNDGTIDVNAKGCQASPTSLNRDGSAPDDTGACVQSEAGAGESAGGSGGAGHGNYGGKGASPDGTGGIPYGDNEEPNTLGASGGSRGTSTGTRGGAGGGLVTLTATDSIENNGSINANGSNGTGNGSYAGGGGAGGSVYFSAPQIDEVGTITANGGSGNATASTLPSAGGAGGRIALHYTDGNIDSYSADNFSATGGGAGSPTASSTNTAEDGNNGTVLVIDDTNQDYTILYGFIWDETEYGTADSPWNSVTIDSTAQMLCDAEASSVSVYANDIIWGGSLLCDKSNNDDSTDTSKRLATFSMTAGNSLEFLPEVSMQFTDEETVFALDVPEGNDLTFDTANIEGSKEGLWRLNEHIDVNITNNSTINSNVYWFIDSLTVDGTSNLNANEKGCRATRQDSVTEFHDTMVQRDSFGPNTENICVDPDEDEGVGGVPWIGTDYLGADGAGHGAEGGSGSAARGLQGQSYGNELRPYQFGSGGGTTGNVTSREDRAAQGGHGGGLILVQAIDSIEIFGTVSANGGDGETTTLADGSDPDAASGGGSGGTIRLMTTDCTLEGTITANGGAGAADTTSQGGGGAGGRIRLAPVNSGSCEGGIDNADSAGGPGGGDSATSGGEGTGHAELLEVPYQPKVTFPYPDSYNNSVNPTITGSYYDDNGGFHFLTDFRVTQHEDGVDPDPDSNQVWALDDMSNDYPYLDTTPSVTVDADHGNFDTVDRTSLDKETVYYAWLRYENLAGESEWSPGVKFQTEYTDETLAEQVEYNWDFNEATEYVYDAAVTFISGLAMLDTPYTTAEDYIDIRVNASELKTKADFWYTINEALGAGNAGEVRYQVGNDMENDGTIDTWNYVDYSAFESDYTTVPSWTEATGDANESNTNTAEELDYYAPAWTLAASKSGMITIRAYLISDGTQAVELDNTQVIVSNHDRDGDGYDDVAYGGDDCDDTNAEINPGADEIWYDGIDQNCDGLDDYDQDGDGYTPDEYEDDSPLPAGDCNDTDASIHPDAEETWYDGVDSNCDGADDYDADGDGYTPDEYEDESELPAGDCNDSDASIHPGAEDVYYDGVDSNCDGASDYDADGDGYDSDEFGGDDCNDADASIHPGADETYYDGVDSNCDGESDFDADEDGYDADSYGGDDCDDSDADVHPGASDSLVDGVDLDCDGFDGPDEDGDGFPPTDSGGTDCDDTDAEINPDAVEIEDDGIDQNCDGVDGTGTDEDGDGFAEDDGDTDPTDQSTKDGGVVLDCDDSNPLVFPTAKDGTRNAVDENCDGVDGPFIVDHVTGTEKGPGIVTVYAPNGSVHYTYEAFAKGGVYPVLVEHQNRYFVAEVKFQRGRYLRVHELKAPRFGGALLKTTKRVSKNTKVRRLAFQTMGKKNELHIVLSTIRGDIRIGQARRIKILKYRPDRARSIRSVRSQFYRVRKAKKEIGNHVSIVKNKIVVIRNNQNKIVFLWNPRIK